MVIDGDFLLRIMMFAFTIANALYAWVATRDKATQSQIRELEKDVLTIKSDLQHVPDTATLHRLELGMQEMSGKVEQVHQSWGAMNRSINRLEEFLLHVQSATAAPTQPTPTRRRTK